MSSSVTLEDLQSQPFQCHFQWGLPYYSANLDTETIVEGYTFRLSNSKQKENVVEQFAYHMSLAYSYYIAKNFHEYEVHVTTAEQLSEEDPGMVHVFRANLYYMLHGIGMRFPAKSIDSFVDPYTSLSVYSQAIIWAVRSLTLRGLAPCAFAEAIKGYEKAISLDPENYQWQLGIGSMKRKLQKLEHNTYTTSKEELLHYIEAVRLGGPKLPLAKTLSELGHDYLRRKKGYSQLITLMEFVHDLMVEVLLEESLLGQDYAQLGRYFYSIVEPLKNKMLAKQCYEEAVSMDSGNSVINHNYAKYLMFQKQDALALIYFKKAVDCSVSGHFPAAMDLMQLQSDLNENYDFNKEVQELLERYHLPDQKASLYCKLGDFLRKCHPETTLRLYQSALNITEEGGLNGWGKAVYKYMWQQQPNGKGRVRISSKRYEFQDIHNEIKQIQKELSKP